MLDQTTNQHVITECVTPADKQGILIKKLEASYTRMVVAHKLQSRPVKPALPDSFLLSRGQQSLVRNRDKSSREVELSAEIGFKPGQHLLFVEQLRFNAANPRGRNRDG